jgi:hypothetical protein
MGRNADREEMEIGKPGPKKVGAGSDDLEG